MFMPIRQLLTSYNWRTWRFHGDLPAYQDYNKKGEVLITIDAADVLWRSSSESSSLLVVLNIVDVLSFLNKKYI